MPEQLIRIDALEASPTKEKNSSGNSLDAHENVNLINNPFFCGKSIASAQRNSTKSEASFNQFPWVVLLQYESNNVNGVTDESELFRCAGALISERHVLTGEDLNFGSNILSTFLNCST